MLIDKKKKKRIKTFTTINIDQSRWDPSKIFDNFFIDQFLIFLWAGLQSKEVRVAKHLCIYEGNGRDAFGANQRKYSSSHPPSHHYHKYLQGTFPWLGWRHQVKLIITTLQIFLFFSSGRTLKKRKDKYEFMLICGPFLDLLRWSFTFCRLSRTPVMLKIKFAIV